MSRDQSSFSSDGELRCIWEPIVAGARIPVYSDPNAAGMDLYAPTFLAVPARSKVNVPLGLKVQIPPPQLPWRFYLRIAARSGTSWNNWIEVGAGVVDYGFDRELGVVLYNHHPSEDFWFNPGDRIAQAILEVYVKANNTKGKVEGYRDGFGSSGR